MSVRKRTWKTAKGEEKSAWIVDYSDASGTRRQKTFSKKKDADQFSATAKVEVRDGVHVADSATVTVKEAGDLWLKSCDSAGLERATIDQYRQHLTLLERVRDPPDGVHSAVLGGERDSEVLDLEDPL